MEVLTPHFNSKNTITIVFSPDNKYIKYFSVALQSLIENANTDYFYNIIVFEKDISDRNKNILNRILPKNFYIDFVNVSEHFQNYLPDASLYSKNYWSESMFYRILIPAILQNFEKVLYIDSDVCITSDLVELFKIDFDDKSLLAVQDSASPIIALNKSRYIHLTDILNLKDPSLYFNSGVLLFNINKIKTHLNNYLEDLISGLKNGNLLFPDQDLLNIVFENKVKLISGKWNCMYDSWIFNSDNYKKCLSTKDYNTWLENREKPCIIHYTSSLKPWIYPDKDKAEIFWQYARKSPFYEEIIFENLEIKSRNSNKAEIEGIIRNVAYRYRIYAQYLRCKILKALTFGKTKKHYTEKSNKLKQQVKNYRKILGE